MSNGGKILTGETEVVGREACLTASLSSTSPTWTGSGIKMRRPWFDPKPFNVVPE